MKGIIIMFNKIVIVLSLVAILALPVAADIAPAFSSTSPWFGEASIMKTSGPSSVPNLVGYMDWIVLNPNDYSSSPLSGLVSSIIGSTTLSNYLYVYQAECYAKGCDHITISRIDGNPFSVVNYGATPGDLDDYHNLGSENEYGSASIKAPSSWDKDDATIPWFYNVPMGLNDESSILWFTSVYGPMYGNGALADTWQGNGAVPVPVPVPAAMVLGMMGLGFIGWVKRRFA
jgi:hypothetical protein